MDRQKWQFHGEYNTSSVAPEEKGWKGRTENKVTKPIISLKPSVPYNLAHSTPIGKEIRIVSASAATVRSRVAGIVFFNSPATAFPVL